MFQVESLNWNLQQYQTIALVTIQADNSRKIWCGYCYVHFS